MIERQYKEIPKMKDNENNLDSIDGAEFMTTNEIKINFVREILKSTLLTFCLN